MQSVFSFIVRLVLLLAGLLVAASIALAVFLLLVFWGLRMLWAKLTGRPVVPFVMRFNPRTGFGQVFRAGQTERAAAEAQSNSRGRNPLADVTDVEPKSPKH